MEENVKFDLDVFLWDWQQSVSYQQSLAKSKTGQNRGAVIRPAQGGLLVRSHPSNSLPSVTLKRVSKCCGCASANMQLKGFKKNLSVWYLPGLH